MAAGVRATVLERLKAELKGCMEHSLTVKRERILCFQKCIKISEMLIYFLKIIIV